MRWIAAALAVFMLVAVGCGGTESADERPVVTVFGPYRGIEAELFMRGLDDWADGQGIDVRYTGTGDFVENLVSQVREASPPDIALVPQPGLATRLARSGSVLPLPPAVRRAVAANYPPRARALGDADGVPIGIPFRVTVKSLVWYRPAQFEELGLTPPGTLAELSRLVDDLQSNGVTPWCLGIEAQSATGWVATDWVEDLAARHLGERGYQRWIAGDLSFGDERIASAFSSFRDLALAPGRAAGGTAGVVRTPVQDSLGGLVAAPPQCALHRQGSLVLGWLPPGTEVGPDGEVDYFVMPGVDADTAPPLVLGVDLAVAFADRPEVQSVMARLASAEAGAPWAAAGGYLSPRLGGRPDAYHPADRRVLDLLLATESVLVDASDAMPPEVGTDRFWEEITRWIVEPDHYTEMARTLDEAFAEALR